MPTGPITSAYFTPRLAAIVISMVLSAAVGLVTNFASQRSYLAKSAVTTVLDGLYQEIAVYSLNLSAIETTIDDQRAITSRTALRRSGERLRDLMEGMNGLELEPGTRDILVTNLFDPIAAIGTMIRIADHLSAEGAPFGKAARRPVAAGLDLTRKTLPQIDALRRSEHAAFHHIHVQAGVLNSASFLLALILVCAAVLAIFRPMQKRVLETQKEIMDQRRAAETASHAKSQFLAVMSHEIRTPLNGVLGMADVMLHSDLPPRHRQSVEVIARSGKALMEIINDVLDLSKIEAGHTEIRMEPFDLAACLGSIEGLFRGVAEKKGIALSLDCPPGPVRIVSDERALRQSVTNLVGNALKFTETGGVSIRLTVGSEQNGRHLYRIAVSDSGIGIEAAAQKRIFDSFTQAESATTRRYGGTGLGLTISRQLVEAVGGRLTVSSTPGKGSTFAISLWARPAAGTGPGAAAPAGPPAEAVVPDRIGGTRVLVVDDSRVNLQVVILLLKRLGLSADTASSGEESIARCQAGTYDIVFMDISMPGIDGYETTRRIRQAERAAGHGRLRIVALSAHAGDEDRARALAAGMDDFLTKPIGLEPLRVALLAPRNSLIA